MLALNDRYLGVQKITNGNTSYHSHEEFSAKIARIILDRYNIHDKLIMDLIRHHILPHQLIQHQDKEKSLIKFKSRVMDWELSIDFACADALGKKVISDREEIVGRYNLLKQKVGAVNG